MVEALDQTPCISGWPSVVRGCVQVLGAAFAGAGGVWPAAGMTIRTARAETERNHRWLTNSSCCAGLLSRLLAKMPIHHLFGELDALEFQELRIPIDTAIERHA